MSIDRTHSSSPVQNISALSDLRSTASSREQAQTQAATRDEDHVSLSSYAQQATADSSRDINHNRLAELRAALQAGTYQIDADQIASALVDNMLQGSSL